MTVFKRWYGSIFDMPEGCYRLAYKPQGTLTASIRCPTCKKTFTIANHTLVAGTVIPSVVCPQPSCTFHDSVQLFGTESLPSGPR